MNIKTLTWSSADYSHVGTVRRNNEDACLAMPERGLWVVADGMGGHEAGEVASRMIVDAFRHIPAPTDWEDFLAAAQNCLQETNQRLREKSATDYHHRIIGSTAVVLLTYKNQGACLWAGDSRLYRLRDQHMELITRDHSHVQELVDQGLLEPEEAHHHPLSNVITRAVGSAPDLDIDIRLFPLQAGDVFLLCTDGLTKVISDAEIARLLACGDNSQAVLTLIRQALAYGANDNVTVIVVTIDAENASDSETTSTAA